MGIRMLPYGRQTIDEEDIAEVIEVLRSEFLTTGPTVTRFEDAVCAYTGAAHGIAVSSGTAALHMAVQALGIGTGDEVIVPPITFAATANAVLYCGGKPVFADVQPDTLLLDPEAVHAAITPRTKAIIGVDYAGQPCQWDALRILADTHGLALVADACHALGASYKGRKVGTLADISLFSFHPVKHITTGEGGMALTNNGHLAAKMRTFRNHGITTTAADREKIGGWFYEMVELGYNYRITDFQCALGISQLAKLDRWIAQRQHLAQCYTALLNETVVRPLSVRAEVQHAWHLYVVRSPHRDALFNKLRAAGMGANVHYIPVYLHPYYQRLGYTRGLCPVAEAAYNEILTLPLWSGVQQSDIEHIHRLVTEQE